MLSRSAGAGVGAFTSASTCSLGAGMVGSGGADLRCFCNIRIRRGRNLPRDLLGCRRALNINHQAEGIGQGEDGVGLDFLHVQYHAGYVG